MGEPEHEKEKSTMRMGSTIRVGGMEISHEGGNGEGNESPWVKTYRETLRFIGRMAGLAALVLVAWWVIPRLGGFFHWLGGLDKEILCLIVVAPVVGVVVICLAVIYAVFFRGTKFVERIVNSQTALESVKRQHPHKEEEGQEEAK